MLDGFGREANLAAGEGRAGTAGVVGDHQGEALILGTGPKSGLARARVADEGDLRQVDVRISL